MGVMADLIRVLYVDDEPSLLTIAKLFLEKEGDFSVDVLTSAREALDRLASAEYDAIVSDYQMPEMNGIALLRTLKSQGSEIPFIIFTGRGREEIVIQAFNEGADFYIQKGGEPRAQFTELAFKIRSAVTRKRSEKRAKDTERRLSDIINFLPDATFAIDTKGHVITWNRAIEEMTGVPARDMVGKGDYEYSLPFYGERRPILIDLVSLPDETLKKEWYSVIRKEGNILIAETPLPRPLGKASVLLGKASRLFNEEGEVVGAIESIRDVSEIRRSEEELMAANEELTATSEELEAQFRELSQSEQLLRISEEKYRVVVENSHDAIYIYRGDQLLFINKMATLMTGFDHDELIRKSVWDLIHPEDRARLQQSGIRRMAGEEISSTFTARILTRSGETRYGNFYVDRIYYQGQPAILGIVKDVTEEMKADEAMRRSEALYRTLLNHTGSATIIIEEDMTVSFVNPEFERILGYTKEEVEGKMPWTLFVVPEDIGMMAEYHRLRRTGAADVPRNYEFRFITKGGETRDAYMTIGIIPDTGRTVASFVDITQNKTARRALEESERKYRNILENIQDVYYRSDREGNLIMMSPSGIQMFGYSSEEEVLGKNIAETFYSNPQQRDALIEAMERDGFIKDFEVELQRRDGSLVTVEANSHRYFDEKGEFQGIEGIFRDITKRKEIMRSLAESEAKFRSIFENIQDVFYRADLAGNLVLFSESGAKKAGYSSAREMIGLNLGDVIYLDPEERKRFVEAIHAQGRVEHYPIRLKTKSGEIHKILANSHLYYDDAGNPLGIEGLLHDVTDLALAEESFRQANRKLALLSGITRHDIMNQLFVLEGHLQLLHDEMNNPALEPHFTMISGAKDRILSMIQFTKEYEQIGTHSPAWHRCRDIFNSAAREVPHEGITVENDITEGLEIFADPLVVKVCYNLIDNAVRYGGTITTLRVYEEASGNDLLVICEDNGGGIAEGEKERVFERGYGKNTGMGLFLAREILAITGIGIRETGIQGQGARFEISIPRGIFRIPGSTRD